MSKEFVWTDSLVQKYAETEAFQSLEDFKNQFAEPELQWFVIPSEIGWGSHVKGWTPYNQHTGDMGGYFGSKYFDTEEEAKEWIIMNKPCLSLSEILPQVPQIWYGRDRHSFFKELVKSKL